MIKLIDHLKIIGRELENLNQRSEGIIIYLPDAVFDAFIELTESASRPETLSRIHVNSVKYFQATTFNRMSQLDGLQREIFDLQRRLDNSSTEALELVKLIFKKREE